MEPKKESPEMTSIKLDLASHCIQTEMKRQHNRLVSACLKGGGDREFLEGCVELLIRALTELDLPAMRGKTRALAGGDGISVVLFETPEGALQITHNGEQVPLLFK